MKPVRPQIPARLGEATGHWVPPHFLWFLISMAAFCGGFAWAWPGNLTDALVVGFDVAAIVFIVSLRGLARDGSVAAMRKHAAENDANRGMVLLTTALVSLAILAAIRHELPAARAGDLSATVLLILTLTLAWMFTNLVFMLHYTHMHYGRAQDSDADLGGFDFPGTPEPDYWDFLYFAFTAGMSFAASDVNVTRGAVRRVVVAHSLLSFVFNIGVLAFAINVLAGATG